MSDELSVAMVAGGFLAAAVRIAMPLLLAAVGEVLVERGGILNLGLEGIMLVGALAAAIGSAAGGPWAGTGAAIAAGVILAGVFGVLVVGVGTDQIITGTAITLGAIGLTGVGYRQAFGEGGPGLSLATFTAAPLPFLGDIPVLGAGLFTQPAPAYLAIGAVAGVWWLLFRTRWGLALRAAGEAPEAAQANGVRLRAVRMKAILLGGGLGGLAGGSLVLAQVGTFAERMTAGRGFVAIAIVVLGRWHPVGVLVAALVFGGATALQFLFQAFGFRVPYQLFLMMPYVLTLLALAGGMRRVRAPAALAR